MPTNADPFIKLVASFTDALSSVSVAACQILVVGTWALTLSAAWLSAGHWHWRQVWNIKCRSHINNMVSYLQFPSEKLIYL